MRGQARLACHSVSIVQKSQDVVAQLRQGPVFPCGDPCSHNGIISRCDTYDQFFSAGLSRRKGNFDVERRHSKPFCAPIGLTKGRKINSAPIGLAARGRITGFCWAADVELLYVSSELRVGTKAVFSGGDMKGLCQMVFLPVLFLAAFPASVALTKSKTAPADTIDIQRGRYLVEEVAKCPECHTPRNARGELDRQAWLQGAPIWIMPVRPIPNWADRAPALAGFPSFTEEQGETSARTGDRSGGGNSSATHAHLSYET